MDGQKSGAWPDPTSPGAGSREPSTLTSGLFKALGGGFFSQHNPRMYKQGFKDSNLTNIPYELTLAVSKGAHLHLNKLTFRR